MRATTSGYDGTRRIEMKRTGNKLPPHFVMNSTPARVDFVAYRAAVSRHTGADEAGFTRVHQWWTATSDRTTLSLGPLLGDLDHRIV